MQKYRDIVIDSSGNQVVSATITITDYPSGSASTIYSDNGITPLVNPFTSSAVDGAYEFYAANGHYTITISKTGFTTETISDVLLDDTNGNYIAQTSATGSAVLPSGTTAQRDASPIAGYIRNNTTNSYLDYYTGLNWRLISLLSSLTGSVFLPSGTTAQRDGTPSAGWERFNSDNVYPEIYDGTNWLIMALMTALTGSLKLPIGTTAQRDGTPNEGWIRGNSTTNDIEAYIGGTWQSLISVGTLKTAVASTSGTSIDFTSIPATAKKIIVLFAGVSTTGTSNPIIQLGVGGVPETTGYLGSSARQTNGATSETVANYTTGIGIASAAATTVLHGAIDIYQYDTNKWASKHSLGASDIAAVYNGGASKTLLGTLDMVRITTVGGTDTFDAGTINVLYE